MRCWLILYSLILSLHCLAQEYNVDIQHYTTEDGLSHPDVLSIVKDDRGIIWVGTANGLNRFDGKKIKVFDATNGLRNREVKHIYIDRGRYLWLLYNHQIDVFDSFTEEAIPLKDFLKNQLPFELNNKKEVKIFRSHVIFELLDGTKYIYNSQNGFAKLPLSKQEVFISFASNGDIWSYIYNTNQIHLIRRKPDGQKLGKIHLREYARLFI